MQQSRNKRAGFACKFTHGLLIPSVIQNKMDVSETILRVCCLGPHGVEIPIYVSPEPARCKWIIVTMVPEGPPADPETYIVYFLNPNGAEIDFAQRDTLEESLDTAKILSQVPELQWVSTRQAHNETGEFDVSELERIWETPG